MDKKDIQAITEAIEKHELQLNETMKHLIDENGIEATINVMVNLSTTLLAKALLMADDLDSRINITHIAAMQVEAKMEEAEAAFVTAGTIKNAMGRGHTCQPLPPKKH